MAGGNTLNCATSVTVSVNRLGDAVVKLTADAENSKASNSESNNTKAYSTEANNNSAVQEVEQNSLMTVYLAYAEDAVRQHYLTAQVSQGTTLYEALAQVGWLKQFEELATWCEQVVNTTTPTAKRWHVGVYAQKQPLNYQLQAFDRVEVYRSLSADPMSQRKNKSRS